MIAGPPSPMGNATARPNRHSSSLTSRRIVSCRSGPSSNSRTRSILPSSSQPRMLPANASTSRTVTRGASALSASTSGTAISRATLGGSANTTCPDAAESWLRTSSIACSAPASRCCACSWKIRPASVNVTPRAVRLNSLSPTSSSSRSSCWLSEGCAIPSDSAARLIERVSAMRRKLLRWRVSIARCG